MLEKYKIKDKDKVLYAEKEILLSCLKWRAAI